MQVNGFVFAAANLDSAGVAVMMSQDNHFRKSFVWVESFLRNRKVHGKKKKSLLNTDL